MGLGCGWPQVSAYPPHQNGIPGNAPFPDRKQERLGVWPCHAPPSGGTLLGSHMRHLTILFVAALAFSALACGSGDNNVAGKSDACATGAEACPCFANDTCDAGLECHSALCVRLGNSGGAPGGVSGGAPGAGGSPLASTGGSAATSGGAQATGGMPATASGGGPNVGIGGMPATAAGGTPSIQVKANGALCASAAECASGTCAANAVGEKHCYGSSGPNEVCVTTYDCNGGLCVFRSLVGQQKVCVPGINNCINAAVSEQCQNSVLAFCQLIQSCGSNVSSQAPPAYSDFDLCVGTECASPPSLTPAECQNVVNYIASGTATCP